MIAESLPSMGLVLPGEAMWGAFQSGFVIELGARLKSAGYGDHPFDIAVGSSSGSLVATVAAAGAPFDHERIRAAWLEFGQATRLLPHIAPCLMRRTFPNPYPDALQLIFNNGLVDIQRAFESPTPLVVTASEYDPAGTAGFRKIGGEVFWTGIEMLFSGPTDVACEALVSRVAVLLESGSHLFSPTYYTSQPWPTGRPESLGSRDGWYQVKDVARLRRAVEASSRVPLLYGGPILDEAMLLIDGVFANNAPVEIALAHGAQHVFVLTSSKKGLVFDRPVQSLAAKQVRQVLTAFEKLAVSLNPLPRGRRLRAALKEIARLRDMLPMPAPLDLAALEGRYPGQKVHVIHPPRGMNVNRFFETDPRTLGRLYDFGKQKAHDFSLVV